MAVLEPAIDERRTIVVRNCDPNRRCRFFDGFAWGFPEAVNLLYGSSLLRGDIIPCASTTAYRNGPNQVDFVFRNGRLSLLTHATAHQSGTRLVAHTLLFSDSPLHSDWLRCMPCQCDNDSN